MEYPRMPLTTSRIRTGLRVVGLPTPPGGGGGGGGGTTVHNELTGRDAATAHPISAITGLEAALATIPPSFYAAVGINGEVLGPTPTAPGTIGGLLPAGTTVWVNMDDPLVDGVYTVSPDAQDLINRIDLSDISYAGYRLDVGVGLYADAGPYLGERYLIVTMDNVSCMVVPDGNIERSAADLTTLQAWIDKWIPKDAGTLSGATPVRIHVIKYATGDPNFPVDGSATHIGGQIINEGQKVFIMNDAAGNGGTWIAHLGAPWERATTLGPIDGAAIGVYDFIKPTGTVHLAETLIRMSGVTIPTYEGLSDINNGFLVTRDVMPNLIATTRSGTEFTIALRDGTTTVLDVADYLQISAEEVFCVLVADTCELVTVAGGAVAHIEDYQFFDTSLWVSRGVPGWTGIVGEGTHATLSLGTVTIDADIYGGGVTLPIAQSDVTDLATDLAAKANASDVTAALAGKASTSHTHTPDHAPGIISSAKLTGGYSAGTPLFSHISNTTTAIALGDAYVAYGNRYARTPLTELHINVTATSLTGSQGVLVFCLGLDSDGFPTGSPLWSRTITVGTSTGRLTVTGLSDSLPNHYSIGVLNPSTNAGAVTLTSAQAVQGFLAPTTSPVRSGLQLTGLTTSIPDVSAFTIGSTAASTRWAPNQNTPIVWAVRA